MHNFQNRKNQKSHFSTKSKNPKLPTKKMTMMMMPMTMMMIMTMTDDDHDDDNEVDDAALLLVIRAWRTATIDGRKADI